MLLSLEQHLNENNILLLSSIHKCHVLQNPRNRSHRLSRNTSPYYRRHHSPLWRAKTYMRSEVWINVLKLIYDRKTVIQWVYERQESGILCFIHRTSDRIHSLIKRYFHHLYIQQHNFSTLFEWMNCCMWNILKNSCSFSTNILHATSPCRQTKM